MSVSPSPVGRSGLPSVLIIDDSAVVRGLVSRWIEADSRLQVAATCADGEIGVRKAAELQPDIVVLDIDADPEGRRNHHARPVAGGGGLCAQA